MDYTLLHPKGKLENKPVASWLLPEMHRDDILALYRFVRGANDIAEAPLLKNDEKRHKLEHLRYTLQKGGDIPLWAEEYADMLAAGKLSAAHGDELISALLQDTVKSRYQSIEETMDYCHRASGSVGRAMLQICEEEDADLGACDALCSALQLLNIIQDCSKDFLVLDRVYIPLSWMQQADVPVRMLGQAHVNPPLRSVFDRLLDVVDSLLMEAGRLPDTIQDKSLRREAGWSTARAEALSLSLRIRDPLSERVELGVLQNAFCLLRAWKR